MPQSEILKPDQEDKLATLMWLDLFNAAKNRQEKNALLDCKPHESFEKVKAWLELSAIETEIAHAAAQA